MPNLSIVIWDFSAVTGKGNRFYPRGAAGLWLTLTFPWVHMLDKALFPNIVIKMRSAAGVVRVR